ncbi:MAG TPA: cytochrome P450 [Elusimicrobiota bacterium]|nr:cytochrome P450 [Elusimicrobiota bacterium]
MTTTAGLPPGPRALPIEQLRRWMYSPTVLLDECAAAHGDWFTIRFPRGITMVVTSDPAAIRDLFAGDPDTLLAGAGNRFFRPSLGAESILTIDGQPHRRVRRLMMPPFHGERMRAYAQDIARITAERVARWPRGRVLVSHHEFQAMALEVILATMFGLKPGEDFALREELSRFLEDNSGPFTIFLGMLMLDQDGRPPLAGLVEGLGDWTPYGRLLRRRRRIDELLQREIERRRGSSRAGGDFLSLFLEARDEHGDRLSDAELRDQMVTLLLAGHETTATSLSWAFRRLTAEPEALSALKSELAGAPEGDPAQAAGLKYLDAVVSEALRIDPVVPLVWRQLTEPTTLGGRELPAGVAVAASIYLAHRRPDVWPEPERFLPQRFFDRRPAPWEYLPFGGGARRCLGMAFAQFEMKLIMAEVLRRADVRAAPGRSRVVRRSVTLAPHDGAPVLVA